MRLPLTVCLPLSLALFSPTTDDTTWFAPEAGLVLAKTLTGELRLAVELYEIEVNGEAQDFDPPAMNIAVDVSQSWQDTYHTSADGRPSDLEREYVAVRSENTTTQAEEAMSLNYASPLVGQKVRFTLGEDGEFASRFVDDTGDEELLEDLRVSVDFLALLPEGEAEVGDTWSGDWARFDEVFRPLGELHTVLEDGTERPENPWSELLQECAESMEGEFEITYTQKTETDGRRVAEFAVRVEGEGSAEGEDSLLRNTPAGEVTSEITRVATLALELEGKLLWDLSAKHFVSFQMGGAMEVTHAERESFDIGERSIEVETKRAIAGTYEMLTEAARK